MSHATIRGSFVREYYLRKAEQQSSGWQQISERDEKHRALNKQYGYAEPDGSFGIGCKSHIDHEYKRRYDAIEAEFRPKYDDGLPGLDRWCNRNGMTVYEYLLVDNIDDESLKSLAEKSREIDNWKVRPIEEKARQMVNGWAKSGSVGDVRRLVDFEIANHHYAAARCRKILELKTWDLSAQKAIIDYGRDWKTALNQSFSNRRLS